MSKEIFVTNAGTSEAMSFIVTQAMQELGSLIKVDRTWEGQNCLWITAENEDVRTQFTQLMNLPEVQVLRDALDGFDIEESKELKECRWSKDKKARIRAFGIQRRSDGFMRDSRGKRKEFMDRARELEEVALKILPEGYTMPKVEDIQVLVNKIVKERLSRKTSY